METFSTRLLGQRHDIPIHKLTCPCKLLLMELSMLLSNKLYSQLAPPWNFTSKFPMFSEHPVVFNVACPCVSLPVQKGKRNVDKRRRGCMYDRHTYNYANSQGDTTDWEINRTTVTDMRPRRWRNFHGESICKILRK